MHKSLNSLDRLIAEADHALRTMANAITPTRASPAGQAEHHPLSPDQARHVAGLMRVNHAGEVAAQALYQGQALTARNPQVREMLRRAADEEGDHLAWCAERLKELGSRTSLLTPFWYMGAFTIGTLAGALGDRASLGFVAETEKQVEGHLEEHLQRLPPEDERSRRILEQMKADEVQHGTMAKTAGGADLPPPIPRLMWLASRVMTRTAYWV